MNEDFTLGPLCRPALKHHTLPHIAAVYQQTSGKLFSSSKIRNILQLKSSLKDNHLESSNCPPFVSKDDLEFEFDDDRINFGGDLREICGIFRNSACVMCSSHISFRTVSKRTKRKTNKTQIH